MAVHMEFIIINVVGLPFPFQIWGCVWLHLVLVSVHWCRLLTHLLRLKINFKSKREKKKKKETEYFV